MMPSNEPPIHIGVVSARELLASLGIKIDTSDDIPDGMDENGHTKDYDCPVCFQEYLDILDAKFVPLFDDPKMAEGAALILAMWVAFEEEASELTASGVVVTATQGILQWSAIMKHMMWKPALMDGVERVNGILDAMEDDNEK